MRREKHNAGYLTRGEYCLWGASVGFILLAFILFDRNHYLILCASVTGATSLIFNAKGNPFGQVLMIVFSLLYAVISYSFAYYGEMITYLGMTAPMSLVALIAWLKNPYQGKRSEVAVNTLTKNELTWMLLASILITLLFYFILAACRTTNLLLSTISVTTSFIAVYLTFRRSPYFALGYAANDLVLIALWILASREDASYLSVVICFIAFLVNDLYGYCNWKKMLRRQSSKNAITD